MSTQDTFEGKVLAFLNDAVVGIDNDHRVTYLNPAAERQYGVKSPQIIGKPLSELLTFLWFRAEDERVAWSALGRGQPWSGENIHRKRDGTEIVVESVVSPMWDEAGQRVGLLAVIRDVTERRAHSERYRRLFEAELMGVMMWDAYGHISDANDTLLRLLGYSWADLETGQLSWWRLTPPESEAQDKRELEQLQRGENVAPREKQFIRKDGTRVWALVGSKLYESIPDHGVSFVLDLTAQKGVEDALRRLADDLERRVVERTDDLTRVNAALREREELYRSLVELAPDGIVVGVAGKVAFVNNAGVRMAGAKSAAQLLGRSVLDFVFPESLVTNRERLERLMLDRQPIGPVEEKLRQLDGRALESEFSASPVTYHDEPGFLAILRDITDRKLTQRALQEGEDRYRKLFENATDAVLIVDAQRLRLEDCSQSSVTMFGYGMEELVGMRFEKLATEPTRTRALWNKFASGPAATTQMPVSYFCRKDGTVFPAEVFRSAYESWGRWKLIVVVRDVSERQRLERAVLEIGEQQQRRIGQDLHDSLCQHLLGISLMSKTLQKRLRTKAPAQARHARQITALVNAAVIEARGLARGMNPVKLEANGLMSALHELVTNTAQVYRIKCQFDCATPVDFSDHNMALHLFRIAQEAVHNALRHSGAKRITVTLEQESTTVVLRVEDNGCGFPKRKRRSAGMGVDTMRYRAAAIGAVLCIERGEKRGTRVTCRLSRNTAGGGPA